jgi:tRNA G18 (ribose-2'-O)-methylase SpoU
VRAVFHLVPIASLDRPELAPYHTMRRPVGHVAQRIFVTEGEKVVRRLLESDFEVVSALMPEPWARELAPLLAARQEDIPVFVAPKPVLEQLTGFSMFQGVLAVGRIPTPQPLAEILRRAPRPWLIVALEALANAENLGVIIRNCAAFGVTALVAGETCSSPFMRRSVRNSMGTIFKLPVVEPPSLLATLAELRDLGVRCVAADGNATGPTLARTDLAGDCCLLFGAEGHGLSAAALAACDQAVAIPMASGVDSLNVGNAAAVFLYEACRQRGRM